MVSHNKRFAIIFNGEIYNFLKLKNELEIENIKFVGNSDTEVLLEALARWGIKKVLDNISSLYTPLNNFFDNVMVNVADIKIKGNRLAILKQVLNTLKIYADFSKIQK